MGRSCWKRGAPDAVTQKGICMFCIAGGCGSCPIHNWARWSLSRRATFRQPVHLRSLEPGYILVTTKEEGLKVVDVSDRTHPVQIAEVRPPEHLQSSFIAHDIFINGKFAYVSQGSGGLNVIDLGDPRHPELVQIVDTPGLARKMVLHDGLLLVADGDKGIYMLDASMPGRLLPIGSLPTPLRANEIATVADGILVSNYPGGTLKLPYPQKLDNYRIVSSE